MTMPGGGDIAAWLRGRLAMAGVTAESPIADVLDVLTVLVVEVPKEALTDWRSKLERALWRVRPPDRASWGLAPEHQQQMGRLAGKPAARPGR